MGKKVQCIAVLVVVLATAACRKEDGVAGYNSLVEQVKTNRVGTDADQWIEMKNLQGEWERVGLVFGYVGDFDECRKAIAGLKAENFAREYRCAPAN